jgi:hypothetical protein
MATDRPDGSGCLSEAPEPRANCSCQRGLRVQGGARLETHKRRSEPCRLSTIRRQALGCWTTFSVGGGQAVGVAQQRIAVISEGGASM